MLGPSTLNHRPMDASWAQGHARTVGREIRPRGLRSQNLVLSPSIDTQPCESHDLGAAASAAAASNGLTAAKPHHLELSFYTRCFTRSWCWIDLILLHHTSCNNCESLFTVPHFFILSTLSPSTSPVCWLQCPSSYA